MKTHKIFSLSMGLLLTLSLNLFSQRDSTKVRSRYQSDGIWISIQQGFDLSNYLGMTAGGTINKSWNGFALQAGSSLMTSKIYKSEFITHYAGIGTCKIMGDMRLYLWAGAGMTSNVNIFDNTVAIKTGTSLVSNIALIYRHDALGFGFYNTMILGDVVRTTYPSICINIFFNNK